MIQNRKLSWESVTNLIFLLESNDCWQVRTGALHTAQETSSRVVCTHTHPLPIPTPTPTLPTPTLYPHPPSTHPLPIPTLYPYPPSIHTHPTHPTHTHPTHTHPLPTPTPTPSLYPHPPSHSGTNGTDSYSPVHSFQNDEYLLPTSMCPWLTAQNGIS